MIYDTLAAPGNDLSCHPLLTDRLVMKNPDPDAVAALGEDYRVTGAVGAGPFKLASFTLGQETVLVRNDDYAWGAAFSANTGPARWTRVTCREIPKGSTAFLALWSGGVDGLLSLPTDFLGEISADAKLAIAPISDQKVYYMPTIKVRQAAALSINQDEILANVLPATGRWRKP